MALKSSRLTPIAPLLLNTKRKLLIVILLGSSLIIFSPYLFNRTTVRMTDWQPITELMNPKTAVDWANKLVRENYAMSGGIQEREALRMKKVSSSHRDLYVVDFNNADLCGYMGCLYAIYTQEGKPVLSIYLRDWKPNELLNLIAPGNSTNDGYPDLIVSQWAEPNIQDKFQYVYSDGRYILANRQRVNF